MSSVLKPLYRGLKIGSAICLAMVIFTTAPKAFAADAVDPLSVFLANKLPDKQQLSESYNNFTYRPLGRKELTFNLVIPGHWRDIPVTLSPEKLNQDTEQMISVAYQRAPETEKGYASIEVAYTRMDLEINLSDYVDQYLEANNLTLLVRREGTFNKRKVEDALVSSVKDSKTYVVRMTFSRDGERIFLVTGSALDNEFSRYAKSFAAAAVSFTLHEKASPPYAEPMTTFTAVGTPKLRFTYPKGWEIEEISGLEADKTVVELKLISRDEKGQFLNIFGYILVRGIAKSTGEKPDQILAQVMDDFKDMQMAFDRCTMRANLSPKLAVPLGILEKWDITAGGTPGEVAFLALPHGNDFIAMGLFTMHRKDNLLAWMHSWHVFEMIAADLTSTRVSFSKIKNHTMPSDAGSIKLVADTMNCFAEAVDKQDFSTFYAKVSQTWQAQTTPSKLYSIFRSFKKETELNQLAHHPPLLEKGVGLDKEGALKLAGYYPTQPETTTFELTYINEQNDWKLLGIHVAMKKAPLSDERTAPERIDPTDGRNSDQINVLAEKTGTEVVFCSSEYNKTAWSSRNLIDGQLGSGHGYASRNSQPAEIVFALPRTETITQLGFNPFTIESAATWARVVQVEVSTQGEQEGFQPVGEFILHNRQSQDKRTPPDDQCFDITPVQARYIKLLLLSNHGGSYIEMGEFKAFARVKQ